MGIIETKTITAEGMPVVVASPEGEGMFPCMILMHERFGLVQHTLDIAKRLATNGYLVATPDLFYRSPDQEALHAGQARFHPSDGEVTKEIEEVAELIGKDFPADLDQLFIMGVCQTGRYPMIYASNHSIKACVTFYGGLSDEDWAVNELHPTAMEEYLDGISVPLLGLYGELDGHIPVSDVLKFRNALEQRNKTYQISIYPGVPHGWLNDTIPDGLHGPQRYRPEAAELAWHELLTFLKANVEGEGDPNIVRWNFRAGKQPK